MSHNDTRHIIHGDTGGSNDDTTAYNDVTASGSQLTFTSINGAQKSVSVSGGGTAVQAYNSVSVSGNDIVFGKTDGSTADTQPLGGLTAITDLQTLTATLNFIETNDWFDGLQPKKGKKMRLPDPEEEDLFADVDAAAIVEQAEGDKTRFT